jgi:hypothetical protein
MSVKFDDVALFFHTNNVVTDDKNKTKAKSKPACGWISTRRPSNPSTPIPPQTTIYRLNAGCGGISVPNLDTGDILAVSYKYGI